MANLTRFSPATDLARLQREFDQMFETFFPVRNGGSTETANAVWSPRVDFAETDDAYLAWLDIPGMSKNDFEINYHDGVLSVSGERQAEQRDEKHNYVRVERSYGRFFRSFTLPKSVNADKIQANYSDGVLRLHIPKAEESKPRRISIK